MEISNSQYIHGAQSLQGPHRATSPRESQATPESGFSVQDEVTLSPQARQLSADESIESSSAGVRFDLVNRIKAEIASGTYDTPDKMDIALERLLGSFGPR